MAEFPAQVAKRRWAPLALGLCLLVVAGAFGIAIDAGIHERREPARCPAGLVALGPHCCGTGQKLSAERCAGVPSNCSPGMHGLSGTKAGCAVTEQRVAFKGGLLRLAVSDWQSEPELEPRSVRIAPFELDAHEVTYERWQACVSAGGCRKLESSEPGLPVTSVTPSEALQFCRFFGGRLPSSDEWLFAATGGEGRRFPWGATGLVCRRAAFGMVHGPCATGATAPDIAGARPDGRTPEGVFDLAGNVAEWTLELQSKGSKGRPEFAARGGSFRSDAAAELKSWAVEATERPADHIGFRCAYD